MEKKDKTITIEVTIYAIIHVVLIVFAFTVPNVTLWISLAFLALFLIISLGTKWLYKRMLKKTLSKDMAEIANIEPESKDPKDILKVTALIFIVFCNLTFDSLYKKLINMLLLLTLPSLIISAVAIFKGHLGENTKMFLYIVVVYFFVRLYLYFLFNLLENNRKIAKITVFVKITLEATRIIFILASLLYKDNLLKLEFPSAILSSVVATIAIDSIMKEAEKFTSKPKKEDTL